MEQAPCPSSTLRSTDAGDSVSPPQRARIDDTIRHLARIGDGQDPRPLRNPDLFGNFAVAYVSPGTAQPGAAAGGRFRSTLGKALFPTRGLFQSVLSPDIVVNKVGRVWGRMAVVVPGLV